MTQAEKFFFETLGEWKENKWILFTAKNHKRFWCNLAGQYKVVLRPDTYKIPASKAIYIGDDLKEAIKAYANLPDS